MKDPATLSKQIATPRSTDLAVADGAKNIHALEAMQRIAERIKDAEALERALIAKLGAQREFAEQYRELFHAGRPENSDRSDRINSDDYCKQFGFRDRTVRRWAERLLDPAKFEAGEGATFTTHWIMGTQASTIARPRHPPPPYPAGDRLTVPSRVARSPKGLSRLAFISLRSPVIRATPYGTTGSEAEEFNRVFKMNPPFNGKPACHYTKFKPHGSLDAAFYHDPA